MGPFVLLIVFHGMECNSRAIVRGRHHRSDAGHFAGSAEAWRHWDEDGEIRSSCAKCHSATGLPFFLEHGANVTEPVSNGMLCSTCHDSLPEFTRYAVDEVEFPSGAVLSFGDYDDDGNIFESLAREIDGLAETLYYYIQNYAVNQARTPIIYNAHRYPYFFVDDNGNFKVDEGETTRYNAFMPRLLKAAYNYQYVMKDPGAYAHNSKVGHSFHVSCGCANICHSTCRPPS